MVNLRFTQGSVALLSEVWIMLMAFEVAEMLEEGAFGCWGDEELMMKVSRKRINNVRDLH